MKLARKVCAAALGGVVVILHAGCVSGPSAGSQPTADGINAGLQKDATAAGAGLWTGCPGFGP